MTADVQVSGQPPRGLVRDVGPYHHRDLIEGGAAGTAPPLSFSGFS